MGNTMRKVVFVIAAAAVAGVLALAPAQAKRLSEGFIEELRKIGAPAAPAKAAPAKAAPAKAAPAKAAPAKKAEPAMKAAPATAAPAKPKDDKKY
jgi:hypothetical protein